MTYPASSHEPSAAYVTFSSHKMAQIAIENLKGTKYKKRSSFSSAAVQKQQASIHTDLEEI